MSIIKIKKNISIIIFLVIFIFGIFFGKIIFYKKEITKKNIDCTLCQPPKKKIKEMEFSTYYDDKYGFSIDYPSIKDVSSIYKYKQPISRDRTKYRIIDGGVSFSYGGKGNLSVFVVENSPYASIDEWLDGENKLAKQIASETKKRSYGYEGYELEKKISVNNYTAFITHKKSYWEGEAPGPLENIEYIKYIVIFKDNRLFVIFTESDNYKKILDSFKFDD